MASRSQNEQAIYSNGVHKPLDPLDLREFDK